MRVLVIGGTGFIGEYLCRELAVANEKVIAVHASELSAGEKISRVRYEKIDLTVDFLDLKRILGEVGVVVFAIQPDIRRMQNILSIIRGFTNIKKIIYLSTLLVYPDSIYKQGEEVAPDPKNDYEKTKYKEEKLLTEFVKNRNCNLCITRLGNVYGDVKNRGVVNNILIALINDYDFYLDGDGLNLRDYIFVEDVARMLAGLAGLDVDSRMKIFNICTSQGNSIIDVVGLVEKIVGKKLKTFKSDKIKKQKSMIGDNQKAVKILNFTPQYSLTEGLKKTYSNYLKFYQSN